MNKKITTLIVFLAVILLGSQVAQAQTATVTTFLTAAIDVNQRTFTISSDTGMTGASKAIYIDRELMTITDGTTTTITVNRGQQGTVQSAHLINAVVWVGPLGNSSPFVTTDGVQSYPAPGPCVRANAPYLPQINIRNGNIWDCPTIVSLSGSTATTGATATLYIWQNAMMGGVFTDQMYRPIVNVAYTALITDYFIDYVSMTSGRTVTLPAVTTSFGKKIIIKNSAAGAQTLTVATTSNQFIGSTAVTTTLAFSEVIRLISVGGGWRSF